MKLHPQVLEKDGQNEFVVLPVEEYEALTSIVEDYEDLMDLREAKNKSKGKKPVPLHQVKQELEL
ncbi:MAG: type II toxin-antitoxin system Phd/YefM family antitoxin [Sedimenticola sp.]